MARILGVLLALSLLVNGYLVGKVADPFGEKPRTEMEHRDGRHGGHRGGDVFGSPRNLPPEARAALRAAFDERREAIDAARAEERRLRAGLADLLAAEPLDADAVVIARDALAAHRCAREAEKAAIVTDIFADLPAETRRDLLARAEERRADWRKRMNERRRDAQ